MLDIKYIRENPEEVIARLAKKGKDAKEEIAHVGDQIFTDVWMAHTVGVTALLVPPICDKKTFFFRKRITICLFSRHIYPLYST